MALRKTLALDSVGMPAEVPGTDGLLDRSVSTALGTSGTVNIDWSLGNYFTITAPTANITLTFSNPPASGVGQTIMLVFKQHSSTPRTVAQPAGVVVAGGGGFAVSSTNNALDLLAYTTVDGGTTYFLSAQKAFA